VAAQQKIQLLNPINVKDSTLATTTLKGIGVGLRSCHYPFLELEKPSIPWLEVLADNYFCAAGPSLQHLEKIVSIYPVTLHCVGMSLGSTDPLDTKYLKKLKSLIDLVKPQLVSDHLCWTSFAGQHFHELLPLPYTEEAVVHAANRIRIVQDLLQRKIMIENVSSYLSFSHSTLTEWDFLQAVADEADCLILLDINNIYVSSHNNHFDPLQYLAALSTKRIAQFHLAGYQEFETHLLDTHGAPVYPAVWKLFNDALEKFGPIPTSIEWDNNIPDFPKLLQEARHAQKIMGKYAITA